MVAEVNGPRLAAPPRASSPTRTARRWPRCRCSPLHDEAGLVALVATTYQAVSGAGLAGVAELDEQVKKVADRATELTHDGSAVTFPTPVKFADADRVQRAAARRLDRRRRLGRDRRGAEAPQREPQDPRHPRAPGVGHLRAGPGLHRPLAVGQRRFERPLSVDRARELLARRPAWSCPTSRRRCRPPARTRPTSAASAPTSASDERGLALFVSNDNLRKGAALNAVQIAELLI